MEHLAVVPPDFLRAGLNLIFVDWRRACGLLLRACGGSDGICGGIPGLRH